MSQEKFYEPLPPASIKSITDSIEIGYQLIIVTLISSDELIGGLAKYWSWNGNDIEISFNTKNGTMFGSSHAVNIPLGQIANINSFPLADDSIPVMSDDYPHLMKLRELGLEKGFDKRLFVQDYPNPWATIIEKHNLEVCKSCELMVTGQGEFSLSREFIPPEGIKLKDDCIFYTDWEFFSHQINSPTTLTTNMGLVTISKDINPSFQAYVFKYLRENFVKTQKIQDTLEPVGINEIFVQGCILVPEPAQDTEIEGETCILVYCANSHDKGEAAYPVLIKRKSLKFPLEFLGKVVTPLILYGELLPVPLEAFGKIHSYTILARAIGYVRAK